MLSSIALRPNIPPADFIALCKWWVGLAIYAEGSKCHYCGQVMDVKGYHALTCRFGGHLGARHNALRDVLCHLASAAGLNPRMEALGFVPTTAQRPGDVSYFSEGWPKVIDTAVTHDCQPLFLNLTLGGGSAADEYARVVKEKNMGETAERGVSFYSFCGVWWDGC